MAEPSRRFPSPWHADPMPDGYVVRDANGQALAYLRSRDNEAEARQANVLTKDEARRIAINLARLPELLGKADRRPQAPASLAPREKPTMYIAVPTSTGHSGISPGWSSLTDRHPAR
jgi:hypothetical protein